MTQKEVSLPDYWSLYRAINFGRFSKDNQYIDKQTGKKMTYTFLKKEEMGNNICFKIFSGILWMSFPILMIVLASIIFPVFAMSFFIAALIVVGYHFAAMYYLIRGPFLEITQAKRKRLFR